MRKLRTIPQLKQTALLTVLLVIVSLTAIHQKAAAGVIDSLYVTYQNSPSIKSANAVFAELFREEFADTLIQYNESAELHDVDNQVDIAMADYYLSCQNIEAAIAACKRANTMLGQDKTNLAQKDKDMNKSANRWLWINITMVSLLLLTILLLVFFWFRNREMTRRLEKHQNIKTNVISYLSQELREPMLTVMEAGQSLKSDNINTGTANRHIGELIVKHCSDMLSLLTQMNIKSKKTAPTMRAGDFVYFIRSIVEGHGDEANKRQIRLEFKTPLKTLFVHFAADHIQHIVDLLIHNSFTHTDPQGTITVELLEPEKDRMRFTVADTGRGIPVENQPYIFTPSHNERQLTHHNKVDTEAVINVTLIKRLLDEMDGVISFKSEPGVETVFTVDLPFLPDSASAWEHEKAMPNIDEWLRQDNTDKENAPMAFIVESDEGEAFLVARHLINKFNLRYARDGHEALQNAKGLLPDIVIADISLPDMEGTEFIRQLRADEKLGQIAIVAMTKDTSEQERVRFIKAGADALLVKPISPEEMRFAAQHFVELRASLSKQYEKAEAEKAPEPAEAPLSKADSEFLNKMVDVIHAQMSHGDIDMERISTAMLLSRKQLRTRVMDLTGLTPIAFVLQVRLNYAKDLMADSSMSLTMIANKCCFQNLSHFSKAFKQQFGVPPQQYRKNI